MDYDMSITFYVIMLVTATAGTGVAFFGRKSYDVATCLYGFAMFLSMCFAMLDWFVPEKIGATVWSTTLDTYIMLVMMGMTFLCYKYDMRHKAYMIRRIEEARAENLRQIKELLSGVGVVDIYEGDGVEIMVEAKGMAKEISGVRYSGFTATAAGTSIFEVLRTFSERGIQLYDPDASDVWDITLFVYTPNYDIRGIYHLVGGAWEIANK